MSARPPAPDRPIGRRPGTPTIGTIERGFLAFFVIVIVVLGVICAALVVLSLRNAIVLLGLPLFTLAVFVVAVVCATAWHVAGVMQRREQLP